MEQEYQAHNLVEQAERKLHPGCWEALCTNRNDRIDQAKIFLERAGNSFKLVKKWFEAGECYERCADIEEQSQSDPTKFYDEASHCFKFVDKKRSALNINKCTEAYAKIGRFSSAGDCKKRLAEEFENDNEFLLAINEYKKASDYYEMESSNSKNNQNTCLIKIADLMCLSNHKDCFEEAKQIYEKVGFYYLSLPLLKHSAKDLFFKCVVVYLVYDDYLSGDAYLSKFINEDSGFNESSEHRLLKEIIDSMKEKNLNSFQAANSKYKQTNEFDKWKVHMLSKILEKLKAETNPLDDFDPL